MNGSRMIRRALVRFTGLKEVKEVFWEGKRASALRREMKVRVPEARRGFRCGKRSAPMVGQELGRSGIVVGADNNNASWKRWAAIR